MKKLLFAFLLLLLLFIIILLFNQEQIMNPKKLFDTFASRKKVFYLDVEGNHHNILVTEHKFYKESGEFLIDKIKK